MQDSHSVEHIGEEEERQAILKKTTPLNNPHPPPEKTLTQQLIDKLDKILAILLIFLLIMFFLQSSGADSKKKNLLKGDLGLDLDGKVEEGLEEKGMDQGKKEAGEDIDGDNLKVKSSLEDLIKQIEGKDESDSEEKTTAKTASQRRAELEEESDSEGEDNQRLTSTKYVPHRRRSAEFQFKQRTQHLQLLRLARHNLDDPTISKQQRVKDFQEQYKTLSAKYKLDQYDEQLSICVVIHASTHKKPYAHEYALNSVFNQNYSDYTVVYIADGYEADEVQPIKEFIKRKDRQKRVKLVWNEEKKYFLESTLTAIRAFCMDKRITALMDGDDELLGAHVFPLLNTFYRRYNANMVYGNFIEYHSAQMQMKVGFSTEYEDAEKKDNAYRSVGQKFGSIKTFKTRLVSFIKEGDLKDKTGSYYRYAGDYALIYPLLELSCGQVRYMPEYNYLYFGYEIDPTFGSIQITNGRAIREKPRYECFKKYK